MHSFQRLVSLAPNDEEKERLKSKVAETRREVRRLIREAESEMKPISVSVEIPLEIPEQMIAALLEVEADKTFEFLSYTPFLLPDIDHIRKQAAEAAKKYIFTSLLSRVSLRDGRKVDEVPSAEGETAQFFDHLGYPFSWVKAGVRDKYQKARQLTKISNWQAKAMAVN
jgi:hypothetical protein